MPLRKASFTAYTVATCLDKLAQLPQWKPFFSSDSIALYTAFSWYAADSYLKRLLWKMKPGLLLWIMDHGFIPGFAHYYLFRKLWIETRLLKRMNFAVEQVIVLGAGFDTLALRLAPKYPDAVFIEIDLPNTQEIKRSVLSRINYPIPANCRFVQADLSQTTLQTALAGCDRFVPDKNTVVILEGVLMYLGEAAVQTLFADLHELLRGRLSIIFGATVRPDTLGNWSLRLADRLLGRRQEGTKWFCPSKDMPEFLSRLGYRLKEWITYKNLQAQYRSASDIAALPDEDENYYIAEKRI